MPMCRAIRLSLQRALDAGDGPAAHQDCAVLKLYFDAPVAADAAPLPCDVRVLAQQPLAPHERGHTAVAAPADGVFRYALRGRERAHFELRLRALSFEAEDREADAARRRGRRDARLVGPQAPHEVRVLQLQRQPDGADIYDGPRDHFVRRDAERLGGRGPLLGGRVAQGRSGQLEEDSLALDAQRDEPFAALLYEAARRPWAQAAAQDGG